MRPKLFIDSGAFTAKTKGQLLSISEYAGFLKQWSRYISVSAGLDVIPDPEATWKNQQEIESYGLTPTPLPTFHIGEDFKWLQKYANEYDYIGLGGTASKKYSVAQRLEWLDICWGQYLTNADGLPLTRVHGFAATGIDVMRRYPWHSVDSTSWIMSSAMGKAQFCLPDAWTGEPDIVTLDISDKSPSRDDRGGHYETLTPGQKAAIQALALERDADLSKLATDYVARFMTNARAYMDFAKLIPYRPFEVARAGDLFGARHERPTRAACKPWDHLTFYLAGEPTTEVSEQLIRLGYNRLLSYWYIREKQERHFLPTIRIMDTYQ